MRAYVKWSYRIFGVLSMKRFTAFNRNRFGRKIWVRAVTLVEMITFIVVMGIAIPTLIMVFAHLSSNAARTEDYSRATFFAEQLLEEIRSKKFDENDTAPWSTTLGVDTGETSSDKTTFDDVDDFIRCAGSDSAYLACMDEEVTFTNFGYICWVDVEYVELIGSSWQAALNPPTDYKRVTVSIKKKSGGGQLDFVVLVSGH